MITRENYNDVLKLLSVKDLKRIFKSQIKDYIIN